MDRLLKLSDPVIYTQTQKAVDCHSKKLSDFIHRHETPTEQLNFNVNDYYVRLMKCAPQGIESIKRAFPTKRDCKRIAQIFSYSPNGQTPIILSNYQKIVLDFLDDQWANSMFYYLLWGLLKHWSAIHRSNNLYYIHKFITNKIKTYSGKVNSIKNLNNQFFYPQSPNGRFHVFSYKDGPKSLARFLLKKESPLIKYSIYSHSNKP